MNGSKQHPIVSFTLSTRFKNLVLTLVIYHTTLFWTPGLPKGVLSNHPCGQSVCLLVCVSVGPSLDISDMLIRFFLIFCIELEQHKGTKVTEPNI